MSRKVTISVDEEVYHGLLSVVGKRKISRFIDLLLRLVF
jgi:predicted CopG family antitoxin